MNRTRDYRRYVRNKHIARKKSILRQYHSPDWYSCDGMYDKGKIHCSCTMCSFRGYNKNRLVFSDKKKIAAMMSDAAEVLK